MGLEIVGGRPMYRVWGCGEHVANGVKAKDTSALFELDMAARMAVTVWYVNSKGGSLRMSEGYRPTGVKSDRYVREESKTSAGMSTQWYQVGRMDRGETPSAIIPRDDGTNESAHNKGRAADTNAPTARDMQLRAEGAYLAGLVFNVASETWHKEPLASPRVDLGPWIKFVQGVVTQTTPTPTPNVQEDAMILLQQSDADRKLFVLQGGAHWINGDELAAAQALNKGLGLTGKGFYEPVQLPAHQITFLSEMSRKANGSYIVRDLINELAKKFAAKLGVKID